MAVAPLSKPKTVLHLVSHDKEFLRAVEQAFADTTTEIVTSSEFSLGSDRENTVLICDETSPSPIACLLSEPKLRHVLAKNDLSAIEQLRVLAYKLEHGTWGIADYLERGALTHTLRVRDYGKKKIYIDQVRDFVGGIPNVFSDLPVMAATVAWELIMNGLFNAPRRDGEPKYREVSRRRDLVVEPDEAVEISFGHDERFLVISASDPFGALSRDIVVANLERASRDDRTQIRRGTQGAGVGLYVVHTSATQLDFQVAPGKRTDVTAVIRLSKRYKDFERAGHSINFFSEESKKS